VRSLRLVWYADFVTVACRRKKDWEREAVVIPSTIQHHLFKDVGEGDFLNCTVEVCLVII
jgi:hypothetical protein